MNKVAIYLNQHLTGSVFDKESICEAYSTDRSMLKIKPQLVALPENTSDVRKIVRFIRQLNEKEYDLPISIRGSGLSKTGADLSNGIVISMEKLDKVCELDIHDRLVQVQSGITLDKLNAVLAPHGLTLPILANPNETIGSLIANAMRDNYSKRYGGILSHVRRIEVVLANGDVIHTERLNMHKFQSKKKQSNLEGEIYDKLDKAIQDNYELIADMPDNSLVGYPLLKNVKKNNTFDLLPVFFGSEGSLGIITEIILRAEVIPPKPSHFLAIFDAFESAEEFAENCEKLDALTVELYDNRIFKAIEESGKKSKLLSHKFEEGFAVLTSFDMKPAKAHHRISKLLATLPKSVFTISEDEDNSDEFDSLVSTVTPFLNATGEFERPNLLNDFYVPKENLAEFIKGLKQLEKDSKKTLELFGCYTTGIYSVRPDFNLHKIDERRSAMMLLRDFNSLLLNNFGSLAGGLPEGRLKPIVIYPELSSGERELIEKVRTIFDKSGIFAPETKSRYNTRSAVQHLRDEPLSGFNS